MDGLDGRIPRRVAVCPFVQFVEVEPQLRG
jgi:hypothetical protein